MSNYQLFKNDLPNKVLKSFKGDISIDTETLGLNVKRDRLCLIQYEQLTHATLRPSTKHGNHARSQFQIKILVPSEFPECLH